MNWTSRLGFAAALLALGVFVAGIGTAGAGNKVKSKVKITKIGPAVAKGKVVSKTAKCERKRKLVLFVLEAVEVDNPYGEASPPRQTKVGTDKTNSKGKWKIKTSLDAGNYRAKVKPKAAGKKRCRGASTGASI